MQITSTAFVDYRPFSRPDSNHHIIFIMYYVWFIIHTALKVKVSSISLYISYISVSKKCVKVEREKTFRDVDWKTDIILHRCIIYFTRQNKDINNCVLNF